MRKKRRESLVYSLVKRKEGELAATQPRRKVCRVSHGTATATAALVIVRSFIQSVSSSLIQALNLFVFHYHHIATSCVNQKTVT